MPKRSAQELEDAQAKGVFDLLLSGQITDWHKGLPLLEFIRSKVQKTCPTNDAFPRDVWWLIARHLLKEKHTKSALLPQICKDWKNLYESFEMARFTIFASKKHQILAFLFALDCCRSRYFSAMSCQINLYWDSDNDEEEGDNEAIVGLSFIDEDSLRWKIEDYCVQNDTDPKSEVRDIMGVGNIHTVRDAMLYSARLTQKMCPREGCFELLKKPIQTKHSKHQIHPPVKSHTSVDFPLDHPARDLPFYKDGEDTAVDDADIALLLTNAKERVFNLLKKYNKIRKFW